MVSYTPEFVLVFCLTVPTDFISLSFTHSPLARLLFPANDDPLLTQLYDDGQRIEPEFYVPIIPMVLVNGSEGIGTGWSTKMCNYNVREIVANIRRLIAGEDPEPMKPQYKNFKGNSNSVIFIGLFKISTDHYHAVMRMRV